MRVQQGKVFNNDFILPSNPAATLGKTPLLTK